MRRQSEAQIKSEMEVQRIMKERGYELSSEKQNNKLLKNAQAVREFMLIVAFVIVLASGAIVIIRSRNNNTVVSENSTQSNNFDISGEIEAQREGVNDGKDENIIVEEENIFGQQEISAPPDSPKYNSPINNPTPSGNYEETEDRQAVDLHQCDEVNQKYTDAIENIRTKTAEFNYVFNNQVPYGEIYEQVGKNAAVADQISAAQQKAINDALNAKKEAYNIANDIYWNEVSPCRKNMYHIDK